LSSGKTVLRACRFFELSNHLGNVLVTVSDKKLPVSSNGTTVDYNTADVITAQDYYPFGMTMPGRKFSAANAKYRYGFNGQEHDKELNENITTALYWEYDSRIGRRWNLDPVPQVGVSDYACLGNNPINLSDADGDNPGPPGKKKKSYDWGAALRYQAIHYNAARVAYNIYRARQAAGHYGTKYNDPYKQQIGSRAAASYQSENMVVTGIDAAAYAKVIEGYYEAFEKGFNWAGDRTMRELKFIFDNKYKNAADIFKPNLSTGEYRDAIYQSMEMLDDLTGTAYTIGEWGEEVFMKCVMFAGLFANRAGNGFGNLNLKAPRSPYQGSPLQEKIANAGVINLKDASPQPNGVSHSFEISGGMLNISGRSKTNGKFDFVITNSGELKIGSGHYYLSGGASSVKAAGRLKIWNGKVTYLNANSGHYRPNAAQAQQGQNLLNQIVNGGR
jgi:RHS repeat-associated protein